MILLLCFTDPTTIHGQTAQFPVSLDKRFDQSTLLVIGGQGQAGQQISVMIGVMLLGTWPTFFFLFLPDMYLYDHLTLSHLTAYLYNRAILLGTPLFPSFVCFLLFSSYGSL